jgi:hypothetical protein
MLGDHLKVSNSNQLARSSVVGNQDSKNNNAGQQTVTLEHSRQGYLSFGNYAGMSIASSQMMQ